MDFIKYNEELSSKSYSPGGGSALCLIFYSAISLLLKSFVITSNRKKFVEYNDEIKENVSNLIDFLSKIQKKLLLLEQNDRENFNFYMDCLKGKKDLGPALERCSSVPTQLYQLCDDVADKSISLKNIVVDSIVSDFDIGIKIIDAVKESSKVLIDINK